MGLDITAYKNLKIVKNPKLDEYGDIENYDTEWNPGASMEWSEEHFPGRGEGIDHKAIYTWEEDFGFRAGSYSSYNEWRRDLDSFARGNSFLELINFADNEGVIGFVVAKKLAKDFKDNENRAKKFAKELCDGEWWLSKYKDWQKAFELAENNGAVSFH